MIKSLKIMVCLFSPYLLIGFIAYQFVKPVSEVVEAKTPEIVSTPTSIPVAIVEPTEPLTIEQMILTTFHTSKALTVAKCESGLREDAVSRTGDYGLFQINWSAHKNRVISMGGDKQKLLTKEFNIKVAYALYQEQNWNPWYMSKHCWSK